MADMTPLEFARGFEIKSVAMYLKLAAETENPLGKKLFYSLATEEIEHAKKIEEMHAKLQRRKGFEGLGAKKLPALASVMKGFFMQAPPASLKKGSEDLSGYELAMKLERTGHKTYARFMNEAAGAAEREFFRGLLAEEQEHLNALANVYSYLTKTGDWLQEEESKTWNWMNI